MDANDLWADAVAFCEHDLVRLGYSDVTLWNIKITGPDTFAAEIYCEDDFQEKVSYQHRVQHGVQTFRFPLTTAGLKNREQRELAVMLAQQGESTALRDLMISAAGRRFVETLCEERAKYAQLCDMRSDAEISF